MQTLVRLLTHILMQMLISLSKKEGFLRSVFITDQGIDEMLFAARAPRGYCCLRKR
jgi:hypothetical protein